MRSQLQSSYPTIETFWMLLSIPILVLIAPRLIKSLIPLTLQLRRRADKSRLTKQIREFNVELSKISQLNEFAKYSKVQRKMRASLDSLKSIQQMDLELKLKYTLVAQAFSWLLAVILTFRLLYKLYVTAVVSLGLS